MVLLVVVQLLVRGRQRGLLGQLRLLELKVQDPRGLRVVQGWGATQLGQGGQGRQQETPLLVLRFWLLLWQSQETLDIYTDFLEQGLGRQG